jgi:uncharacterized protein
MSLPIVTDLYTYPLKSARPLIHQQVDILSTGLEGDRTFVVMDQQGNILTAREYPKLLNIDAVVAIGVLNLLIEGVSLAISLQEIHAIVKEGVLFGTPVGGRLLKGDYQSQLSDYLGISCSILVVGDAFLRTITSRQSETTKTQINYTDAAPILLTTQASLVDLNSRLAAPISMNRFRPNIIISGGKAFEEDDWRYVKIGSCEFEVSHLCPRCILTTIDPENPQKGVGVEPLKTLSIYRKTPSNKINFGIYLIPIKLGTIAIEEPLMVIN